MAGIEPEPVLGSQTVFSGHLIHVRKETVRLPTGKTAEREVVDHPEVVAMIPVLDDGKLVLVRQYRAAVARTMLEVPAGGIDPGESPEQAAQREMIEETGYRVGRLERIYGFYSSPGFCTEYMHLLVCSGLEAGTPTEETDQIEVVSLGLDDAIGRIGGEIVDAKSILALLYWRERTQHA
jgi:ADP-ribose pyrophosphatase